MHARKSCLCVGSRGANAPVVVAVAIVGLPVPMHAALPGGVLLGSAASGPGNSGLPAVGAAYAGRRNAGVLRLAAPLGLGPATAANVLEACSWDRRDATDWAFGGTG